MRVVAFIAPPRQSSQQEQAYPSSLVSPSNESFTLLSDTERLVSASR